MRQLPNERRIGALRALLEGLSMESTMRLCGISYNALSKLLRDREPLRGPRACADQRRVVAPGCRPRRRRIDGHVPVVITHSIRSAAAGRRFRVRRPRQRFREASAAGGALS